MARQGLFSPFLSSPSLHPSLLSSLKVPCTNTLTKSNATPATTTITHDQEVNRRSANYPPSSWDYNLVKSLTSDYTVFKLCYANEEKYGSQVDELKEYVKNQINGDTNVPLAKMELIDSVQRLGLKYHFEKEIKKALDAIYSTDNSFAKDDAWLNSDLYATALRFRLFRQHGYDVPQDVFEKFKDETGNFKACLCKDVKGLLSLYEASFFGFQGEDILDDAKTFTTTHLKSVKGEISPSMQRKVKHALDMPLHWTMPRVEARWFINTCMVEQNTDSKLLQLAKLDYNIVQSIHQKEVSKLARWWMDLGLHQMSFFRDRLVEHYSWCSGIVWEPQYGAFREMTTKVISLITVIDDIYDVYGSIEELELFTNFVNRWDITEVDKLPYNIRIVFLAMFNMSNEIGYWTLKERGFNIIPYLSKQWAYLCNSCIREAKMFHEGYRPSTLDEYLDNAVVSIGALMLLFCSYFLTTDKLTVEALNYIDQFPSIMKSACMIGRLINDLVTSSDESARGDAPKAIQCYMKDTGATEQVAREYINSLIHENWKILNGDMHKSYPFFSEPFVSSNVDAARTAHLFYHHGDGHGTQNCWTIKDHLISLLVQPFTLN